MYENGSTKYQKLWDETKEVTRGKFIEKNLHWEISKISNNLILHIKELDKEEQTEPKINRRKKIIKIRYEIETKETIEKPKKSIKPKTGSLKI